MCKQQRIQIDCRKYHFGISILYYSIIPLIRRETIHTAICLPHQNRDTHVATLQFIHITGLTLDFKKIKLKIDKCKNVIFQYRWLSIGISHVRSFLDFVLSHL